MHLRNPDLDGDFGLGQVLDETQAQDATLLDRQRGKAGTQKLPVGDRVEARVDSAENVEARTPTFPARCGRGVQRLRMPGVPGVQRPGHVHLIDAKVYGELSPGGCTTEFLGEVGAGWGEADGQVLYRPWHPHAPGRIPEMAFERTDDGRDRVGGERHRPVRVVPVDGVDQSERGDLEEVVQRLTTAAVPAGQTSGQRQRGLDTAGPQCNPAEVTGR
jgi:hypothetical protein